MLTPWVESPAFHTELASRNLPEEVIAYAKQYHEDGYFVGDGMLDDIDVGPINSLWRHAERERVSDAWVRSDPVRRIATSEKVLGILRALYGREPVPFQTLNFKYGTEQEVHSDTIHFNTITSKWMCGVWVALEDVEADQGPLVYYPGTHRFPEYDYRDLGISNYRDYERKIARFVIGREPRHLLARRGQFVVWASNLLHGGSPVLRRGVTRMSQVTHYFFEDVIPYTPLASDVKGGEYQIRTPTNIRTGQPMKISFHGTGVFLLKQPSGLFCLKFNEPDRAAAYLKRYQDVKSAGGDPFVHYVNHGHKEGRFW